MLPNAVVETKYLEGGKTLFHLHYDTEPVLKSHCPNRPIHHAGGGWMCLLGPEDIFILVAMKLFFFFIMRSASKVV